MSPFLPYMRCACKGVCYLPLPSCLSCLTETLPILKPKNMSDSLCAPCFYVRLKEDMYTRVIAAAVLPKTERGRKKEERRERECIPDGFLISAFGQDLIPSLSCSPLLVKPSTYHTGFLILSRDPMPRQQH